MKCKIQMFQDLACVGGVIFKTSPLEPSNVKMLGLLSWKRQQELGCAGATNLGQRN